MWNRMRFGVGSGGVRAHEIYKKRFYESVREEKVRMVVVLQR